VHVYLIIFFFTSGGVLLFGALGDCINCIYCSVSLDQNFLISYIIHQKKQPKISDHGHLWN